MDEKIRSFIQNDVNGKPRVSTMCTARHFNNFWLSSKVIDDGIEGDFVELGCFQGGTAKLLALILESKQSNKMIHLFDSFEGVPNPDEIDGKALKAGSYKSDQKEVENYLRDHNCKINPGWFKDTLHLLPNKISFAHLDSDFYEPIEESLEAVYPKMESGAICVVDDYAHIHLKGVKKAVDEFFEDKPEEFHNLMIHTSPREWGNKGQGFFTKL